MSWDDPGRDSALSQPCARHPPAHDPHGHDLGQDPLVVRRPGRARGHPGAALPAGLRRRPPRAPRLDAAARSDRAAPGAARARGGVPARVLQPRHARRARPVREGHGEVPHPLPLPGRGGGAHRAPRQALPHDLGRRPVRRHRPERRLRRPAAARQGRCRHQPRQGGRRAADPGPGRRRRHQRVRAGDGRAGRQLRLARRLPRERARARPEPPRDHALHPDPRPAAVLAADGRALAERAPARPA